MEDPGYEYDPEPTAEQRASRIAFEARRLSAAGELTAERRAALADELEAALRLVDPDDAAPTRLLFEGAAISSPETASSSRA
jgi:hypothetical protein